jgi:hypothetical protein
MATQTRSIRINVDRLTTWKVNCDGCKQQRNGPFRLLTYGNTAAELCPECFEELKAAIGAQ